MKMNTKADWRRWMLLLGTAAALASGAAFAMRKECWQCSPCGCGTDGGQLLCCDFSGC